ncbi:MAG: hypothetical protein Q9216_006119 [Gyalolechia sp. 2 TL-2023]
MGKKRKHLSHEEIWDDSALLDSWDAALQEYQLYHSIHARGERVEDVLRDAEASQELVTDSSGTAEKLPSSLTNGIPHSADFEDGEIEEGQVDDSSLAAVGAEEERVEVKEQSSANQQDELPTPTPRNHAQSVQGPHGVPDLVTTGGKIGSVVAMRMQADTHIYCQIDEPEIPLERLNIQANIGFFSWTVDGVVVPPLPRRLPMATDACMFAKPDLKRGTGVEAETEDASSTTGCMNSLQINWSLPGRHPENTSDVQN